ncbi:MAG: N-acyl homoserine lactonase family protein [Ectothiorhodospiraceae bacterium]|nr:N-acyl homoserine lactonase family protein [Ectothiorhodospiraceae bacterium]
MHLFTERWKVINIIAFIIFIFAPMQIVMAGTKNSVESLTVFECGKIQSPDRSLWSPGVDVNVAHKMVASCYLIRHKNGTMVWDTGIPAFVAKKPKGVSVAGGKITLFLDKPFPQLLEEHGISPASIDHLAISHMHPDHSGNANAFSNATWYVQEAEYAAAFGLMAKKLNFNLKTYNKLKDGKVVKLNHHHDVFGDGSVVIIPAPGHTPGHQVLFVRLPSGPVLLSGDLWHFRSNYENGRVPGFNFDKKETKNSMAMIDSLITITGAKLLLQHDSEQNATIPHAPQSLR